MTARTAVLISAAIALLLAGAAGAAEIDVRGANQLEAHYGTDVKESVLDDRLDLDFQIDRFTAGIVFLSHTPSNYLRLDPNQFGPRQEGIRKRWVTGSYGGIDLRLGDSYATFGSGLVLRIFEDQAVDFDNVVDGFHISTSRGIWSLEGIGGTNSYGDARTMVKGISARVEPAGGWLFGANAAVIDSIDGGTAAPGRDGMAGLQANALFPAGIDVTAEYAIRRYSPERPGRGSPDDGHAAYGAIRGDLGPFSLLLEGKDILRFQHAYANPPTAVRQHTSTLLNRGSHVPNIRLDDERGFQSEVLWSPRTGMLLTGNYSQSEARHSELPAWEVSGMSEIDMGAAHGILWIAESEEKVREGIDRFFYERITLGGDLLRSFEPGWAVEVGYETQLIQQQDLARADREFPHEYRDQIASLTVSKSPNHSWAATIEWSDDPKEEKSSWVWLEWNIRLGLIGQLTVGGGTMRGGQVCSGGVCKLVDPFEGGRLELLTNF